MIEKILLTSVALVLLTSGTIAFWDFAFRLLAEEVLLGK